MKAPRPCRRTEAPLGLKGVLYGLYELRNAGSKAPNWPSVVPMVGHFPVSIRARLEPQGAWEKRTTVGGIRLVVGNPRMQRRGPSVCLNWPSRDVKIEPFSVQRL